MQLFCCSLLLIAHLYGKNLIRTILIGDNCKNQQILKFYLTVRNQKEMYYLLNNDRNKPAPKAAA